MTPASAAKSASTAPTGSAQPVRWPGADARRILLCLRYGIGDVVSETAFFDSLRAAAPRAHITAIGAQPAIALLAEDPRLDRVIATQRFGLGDLAFDTPKSRRRMRRWLRGQHFDLVLDALHAIRTVRYAIYELGLRQLEAHQGVQQDALTTGASAFAATAAGIRAGWHLPLPPQPRPRLFLRDEELAWAAVWLRRNGLAPGRVPVISPVASLPLKQWPVQRYAAVADWLVEHARERVLILEAPESGEPHGVQGMMRQAGSAATLREPNLRRVAAVLAHCGLLICNDTGVLHIAAAFERPVVAVFGPTSRRVFLPPVGGVRGLGGDAVDCPEFLPNQMDLPRCWLAGQCLHGERSCIDRISIEQVIAAAAAAC